MVYESSTGMVNAALGFYELNMNQPQEEAYAAGSAP